MQKKLMMIVILLLSISSRMAAEDNVSISDFNIFKGQSKEVSIILTNSVDYAGFQFDLELPDGITVKTKTTGGYEYSTTSRIPDGTEVSVSQIGGVYRFVAIPLGSSISNFAGSSGEAIINLTIQADENATEGAFTGRVKNIKLSNAAGTNSSDTFADQQFTATIRGDEPYAVLEDDNKTLAFYYDKEKDFRTGAVSIELGWNSYKESITSVVFDNSFAGCTSLTSTSSWFSQCTNLTSITGISNLKTDNVTSMRFMFNGCSSLTSLDLSNFNTSNVTDMGWMFKDCSSLTSINLDINKFDTQNVTDMGLMFEGCSSLIAINVSHFNTEKVTNMGQMFRNCSSLTSLDVSNFKTDIVESMHSMFNGCSSLAELNVSSFNTEKVTDIASMFYGCSGLTSLDVSNFRVNNITALSSMFNGCELLTTIDISGFNTSTVTEMNFMFYNCSALKTIYVGDGWSTDVVTSSANMFTYCEDLIGGKGTTYNDQYRDATYGRIDGGPNSETPGYLTNIADKGKNFPYAVLSDDNTTLTFYYNGNRDNFNWMKVGETSDLSDKDWLGDAYATSITSVVFDESFAGYTELSSTAFWFYGLSNLETISGLNYLNTGNVTNMNSMFRGCQSLTTLDLSGFNTAKVTDMGSMFTNCSGLSTLTLSGSFDTGQVVYMNEMFENCTSLTELDLSRFNIAKVENMNSMFCNASNLKTIYVGTRWSTTLETAGSNMFSGCTSLVGGSNTEYDENIIDFTYARIDGGPYSETPGYYTDIANKGKEVYMVLTDGNSKLTFYYDANKATRSGVVVDLFGTSGYGWSSYKEYITSVEFDLSFADYHGLTSTKEWFMSCNNIESITGISYLNTENVTDMTSMFQYCSALTELDLGSLNTSNVTKMTHMFYDCQNLVGLNISGFNTAKVTGMEAMFYNCNKLTSLNLSSFVTDNVTNMQELFWSCSSLTDIDVTGFETGLVTSMAQMFYGCSGLTTLDLSSFNTVNATEMTAMFQGCSNLVTIYVGDNWSYEQAATGGNLMFDGCTSIVGGSGTEYSSANYDWRYAHVDGGTANPGYLTDVKYKGKTDEAYAVLSSDSKTLTFYYDKDKEFRTGVVDIDTGSGLGWESYSSTITSVVFDDSFANYTSLTSTASWFMGCTNLTSITGIANLKTDNVTNMYAMFYNCSSLTSLDVSGFVTDNVTNMEKMFSACDFTTLDISNFKTDKVTNMKEMFRECRSLATLTLDKNNFKTDNVTNMWLMFKDCESLTSLDVSGFNTANVTDMTLMFHGCKELTTLDVSGFNTAKVTTMEGMFNGCEGLTTLDLSSFNTILVTNMMSMFYGCTSLTTISVSDKWSNEGVAEGTSTSTNMFYNCTSLVGENGTTYDATRTNHLYAHIDIAGDPGYFTNVIPTEPYAALSDENTKLTFYYDKMKADRNGMSVGPFNAYFDIPWSDVRLSITTVKFDNSFANYTGLTSTKWMLGDLAYLESIEGIENLKTDNVTDMSNMFNGCGITSLDLSSLNTTNVTNMSSMFEMCLNLKTLDVSNFNTANVTDMSHMFYRCEKLENLNITNFVTSSVTDMSDMFHDCKTLTSLDLSSFNTEKVTQMGEFFWGDANLQTIIVGKGWSTAAITGTHEESTFKACNALVGENGTTYDESHIGIDYAHIDGGAENPGYFTDVRPLEPYAVLSSDNKTLTFYYDKKKEYKGGMSVGPFAASNERGWYSARNTIETVVFDETFANCTSITSTAHWFDTLTGLSSISGIERLNTSGVTDMNSMFNYCFNLEEVDLSTFNTANVTDMNNMFAGCSGLTTLNFGSGFNTEKVTTMERMFIGCGKLTSLDLSGFNTANVTDMSEMFSDCTKLTSLDVSSFNTAKVTDMDGMFNQASSLKTIYVDPNKWVSVDESSMFTGCTSLVGGEGTTYNSSEVGSAYARIDDPANNKPGYLTDVIYKGVEDEPYAVLASNGDEITTSESTVNGKTLTFYYDKKKVAISDAITIVPFSNISEVGWIGSNDVITKVVFDDSFADCTSLTSTAYWFYGCTNLATITGIGNLKTENVTTMQSMFESCTSLTELDLTGFSTSKVTNMSRMFNSCSGLTSLDLSHFDVSSVQDMSSMFYDCRALTSINLSNWVTSKNTSMNMMFMKCSGLTELDLGSFNTASVTDMYHMFAHSYNLKTIYVGESGWTTSKVENGTEMFYGCSELVGGEGTLYSLAYTNYDYAVIDGGATAPGYLTNVKYKGVEDEPYAVMTDNEDEITTDEGTVQGKTLTFYYDKKKEDREGELVDINDLMKNENVDKGAITIAAFDKSFGDFQIVSTNMLFSECSNLTTIVDIKYLKTDKVRSWWGMFYNCSRLTNLDVSGFNTGNAQDMSYMFANCSSLTELDVSKFNTEKVTDMSYMFYNTGVTSLNVKNFDTSNVTDMSYMFGVCKNLANLDVSEFNTEKVTTMNYMFGGCSSLANLDVSKFNTEKVTDMSYMFYSTAIESLNLNNFDTSIVTDMSFMFNSCENLTSLEVNKFNTESVTNMRYMFFGCTNLTSLNVSKFNTASVTDMSYMFSNCFNLESLDMSGFNTEEVTNMLAMFFNSKNLTTIYAGDGWTTKNLTKGADMFTYCTKLIGGKGTMYDEGYTDHTYACIDGGPNSETPGYFTDINAPASYEVKVRAVGNGQVTIDRVVVSSNNEETVTVDRGSAITMVFTPDEGYKLESVVVDNTDVTSELEAYNETGAKIYTLDRIYDYHKVTATFANNTVTLTAKSYTRKYGEENPEFEYTAEGADFSGKPTITCEATDTTSVGTYPIVITYTKAAGTRAATNDTNTSESSGVKVVCVNGTLTITKAPLKVAAKSYTIKRGGELPDFEVEYSGFKNNETEAVLTKKAVATCEAKADAVPGTYQIVVSGAEAKNYEMEYEYGSLTITDDVVVTAKDYTREYGEANPTFEYTVDGAILEGKPAITCEATATSPVGTYEINIAKGDITNSDVTYVKGTLTITKAPLTITAKSYTIKQGKDLPTLEVEYSGFKNNETEAVFTASPTISTNASKNSEPGTYAITVSGAEATNYEMTYVNGTLTITAKTETFDGDVLTVEEGGNIDDAFESMGGRDEAAKTIAAIIWNSTEPLTSEMLKGLDNPNMLIYVQSKKQAPKDRNNVVINGVAEYVKLTDTGTGNHNFYAPVEFVADSITYTREFKQETRKNVSRGWEGICLPFTVQTFTHESHGKIAPFGNSASNYHFWLHQFTEDGIVDAETIEANKPYIISMPNSNEYYEEFNQAGKVQFASADVTIPVTETMVILLGDSVEIVPTFQAVEKSASVYALNVSDSIISSFEGSIFVSNYREVKPFEVYTFHEPSRNEYFASRFISVSSLFGGDSDSTGIIDVMEKQNGEVVKVYSINGNLIKQGNRNEVMNSLPKGLYIIGNQKIMVK